ncbi:MAG: response regulator [Ignavibacteriaceae bacterium]|nr:response regulator [Ignavibacteriaceae bacterium]NUM70492.1 response regulator [Ignavibacteriaceae bacterium]
MNRILVIEDEDSIRETITDILEAENYEVFSAENGAAGIDLAREVLPDLILCDVMMPGLSGFDVLAQLRKETPTEATPFIFLTARSEKESLREGMNLGADDYLTKPFTIEDLLAAIKARLRFKQKTILNTEKQLEELRLNISFAMPHELNTPIFSIIGFAESIRGDIDNLSKEEISEMAGYIHSSAKRLKSTIDKFLVYVHLRLLLSNKTELEKLKEYSTFLEQDILETVAMLCAKDYNRQQDIAVFAESADTKIKNDHFSELIREIIDNALKFSNPHTNVEITGLNNGDRYDITVRDYGRGMNLTQLSKIGAFMQFDRKLYEQQGTGMGLYIAKAIAEIYDGDISISSEPDKGTTVTVSLMKRYD